MWRILDILNVGPRIAIHGALVAHVAQCIGVIGDIVHLSIEIRETFRHMPVHLGWDAISAIALVAIRIPQNLISVSCYNRTIIQNMKTNG